jgi:nitrogen fixation protein FixH
MTVSEPIADGGRKPFRITGLHVLVGMIVFFAIIIGLDIFFVTLAYRSFSGEVASNPYEAGLAFNQKLAEERRQAALGWTVTIGQESPEALVITVKDRDQRPLPGLAVEATLERPATTKGRSDLVFRDLGQGRYRAAVARLDGAWDLRASIRGEGDARFEAERRLIWP